MGGQGRVGGDGWRGREEWGVGAGVWGLAPVAPEEQRIEPPTFRWPSSVFPVFSALSGFTVLPSSA